MANNPVLAPPPTITAFIAQESSSGISEPWLRWFQAIVAIFGILTNRPANTVTPVAWAQFKAGGKTYYVPLYQ